MNLAGDPQSQIIVIGVLVLLSVASLIGWILQMRLTDAKKVDVIKNLNSRINAWWVMAIVFFTAAVAGRTVSIVLFGLVSFSGAARIHYLDSHKKADHRALFWLFFVILPLQYYLLAINWLLYIIFIPVYAYLWIPIRIAIAGDTTDFLARTAKVQWALMVCVYFVSYAPALLDLRAPGYEHQA